MSIDLRLVRVVTGVNGSAASRRGHGRTRSVGACTDVAVAGVHGSACAIGYGGAGGTGIGRNGGVGAFHVVHRGVFNLVNGGVGAAFVGVRVSVVASGQRQHGAYRKKG